MGRAFFVNLKDFSGSFFGTLLLMCACESLVWTEIVWAREIEVGTKVYEMDSETVEKCKAMGVYQSMLNGVMANKKDHASPISSGCLPDGRNPIAGMKINFNLGGISEQEQYLAHQKQIFKNKAEESKLRAKAPKIIKEADDAMPILFDRFTKKFKQATLSAKAEHFNFWDKKNSDFKSLEKSVNSRVSAINKLCLMAKNPKLKISKETLSSAILGFLQDIKIGFLLSSVSVQKALHIEGGSTDILNACIKDGYAFGGVQSKIYAERVEANRKRLENYRKYIEKTGKNAATEKNERMIQSDLAASEANFSRKLVNIDTLKNAKAEVKEKILEAERDFLQDERKVLSLRSKADQSKEEMLKVLSKYYDSHPLVFQKLMSDGGFKSLALSMCRVTGVKEENESEKEARRKMLTVASIVGATASMIVTGGASTVLIAAASAGMDASQIIDDYRSNASLSSRLAHSFAAGDEKALVESVDRIITANKENQEVVGSVLLAAFGVGMDALDVYRLAKSAKSARSLAKETDLAKGNSIKPTSVNETSENVVSKDRTINETSLTAGSPPNKSPLNARARAQESLGQKLTETEKDGFLGKLWTSMKSIGERKPSSGSRILDLDKGFKGVISDKSENIITRLKTVDSKIQWKQFRTAKDLDATLDIPLDLSKRLGRDPNKFPVDEFEESLRRWTQFQSKGTKSMGIDSKDVERFKSYWENKLLGVDRLPEPSRYLSKKQMDQIVDAYGRAPRASGVTIREGIDASKKTWRDDFIRQGLHDHLEKTGAFAGRPGGIRFSEDDLKMIGEELAKKADQEALERASKSAVKKAEGPAEAVLGEVRLGEATLADTKAISVSPISRATLDGEASLKLQKIEKELADLRVGKEWTKDVNKIRNHLMREDALMKQAAQIRGKLNPGVDEISKHVRAIEAKIGKLSDAEKLVYAHNPGLQNYVEQGMKNSEEFKAVLRDLVEQENKKTIDAAVKALGDLTEKQKENILRAHYHDPLGAGKIKELIGGSGNLSRKQTLGRVRILSEGEGALTPEQYQRLMDRSIVGGGASHGAKSLDTPSSGFFQYSIGPAPKPSSLASEAEIAGELQNAIKRYDGYTKQGVSPTIDNFVEKVRIGRRNGAKEIDAAVALEREFESFESYLRKELNSSSHPLRDKEHAKELIEKMDNIIEEVLSKTSDPMSIPLSFRKQLADKIQKYAVEFAPSGARDWKNGDLLRKWMPEKKYFNELTEVKATAWKDAKRAIHWESLSPETQLKIENALYRSHLSGNRTAQQIEDLKQPWIREFQKKNARSPTPAELDAFTPPATKDKIRALVDASKKVEETLLKELGEGPLKHLTKGNPRYIKDRVIKPLADAKVLGVEEASDFVKNLPTNTDEIFEAAKQVKKNYSVPANKNVLIKGAIEDKSKLLEMQQEYFKLSAIKTGMIKHPPKDSGVINTVNSELKELSQILALAMPKHGSRFADFEKEVASQVAKYTDELNGPGTRAIDNAASTIASASSGAVARLPVDDVFKATTKDAQAVIGDDELVKKITGFAPMSNVSRRAKLEDLKRLAQKLEDELKATQLTSRSNDLPPGADFILRARENAVDDIKKLIAKGESEFTDQMQRTQYVIREISTKYYPDFRQQQLINSQLTTSSGLARSIREAEEDAQRLKNIMRQRAEKGFDDLYHSTKTQMGDPPPKLDAIDDKLKEIEGHLDLLYKKKFQLEASNLPKTSSTKEMIEAGEKKLAVKLSDPEKLILAHNPALQRELLGELPNPKDFVAKLKSLAKEDEAHTLSKAAKELGVDVEDLSKPKRDAILAAHYVDPLGPGKTKALIGGAGNLSDAQIKKRIEILQPHFTKEEYKRLMDRGVVGGSPKNTEEILEEIKTVKDFRLSALRQQRKKLEEASGKLKAASNEAEKKIAQQLYDQAKRMVDQTESHIKKLDEEIKQISSGRANLSAKVTKKPEISFSLVSMESVPPIKIDETLSEAMKRDISAKGYLSGLANRPGEPKTWEDLKAQLQSHPEGVTNFQQVYGNMVSPITMVRLKGAHFAKLPPDDLWRLQAEASLAMHEWLRRNLNSIKTVEPKEHLEESFSKFDAGLKELFSDQNL